MKIGIGRKPLYLNWLIAVTINSAASDRVLVTRYQRLSRSRLVVGTRIAGVQTECVWQWAYVYWVRKIWLMKSLLLLTHSLGHIDRRLLLSAAGGIFDQKAMNSTNHKEAKSAFRAKK